MNTDKILKKGLSLVEAVMVLAVGAVVIAGILLFLQSAMSGNNLNKSSSQVLSLISTVKQLYASQTSYTGLTNAAVYTSMPRDMQGASGVLINGFGGPIIVATAPSPNQAMVTFVDVPRSVCPKLATSDFGNEVVDVLVGAQTTVGTAAPTPTTVISGGRPNITSANTNCSADNNTVRWIFR